MQKIAHLKYRTCEMWICNMENILILSLVDGRSTTMSSRIGTNVNARQQFLTVIFLSTFFICRFLQICEWNSHVQFL